MKKLSMTSQLLLHSARAASEPTDVEHGANQRALARKLGARAFVVSALAAKTTGATLGTSAVAGVLKLAIVPVLFAAIGTSGYVGWKRYAHSAPEASPRGVVTAPLVPADPVAPVDSPTTEPAPEIAAAATVEPERAVSPAIVKGTSRAGTDLELELATLEDAQRALKSGDPRRALHVLDTPSRGASHVMGVERHALRAIALCSLGDTSAKSEAKKFLDAQGTSPLASRVRKACEL